MKNKFRLFVFVVAAGLILLLAIHSLPSADAAGPWYVSNSGSDGNDCASPTTTCASINGALSKPGFVVGDTVFVATGTYTGTGTQVVLINKSVVLSGGWDASFTTQGGMSTIDGQNVRWAVWVSSGAILGGVVNIDHFTVRNGYSDNYGGAGILNHGTLTIVNSVITANKLGYSGVGGGIRNDSGGVLTLNNSIVSGNDKIGIFNACDAGNLTLNNSTVRDNMGSGISAPCWPGTVTLNDSSIQNNLGTGIAAYAMVILNRSLVSGNSPDGGIVSYGSLILNNSTISGNKNNGYGGGIYHSQGDLILNNSTVTGNNTGETGGGIYQSSFTAVFQNSLIAGNTAFTGISPDCNGSIDSAGYNLIGNTAGCYFSSTTGDITGVSPNLGPLDDYGGPTLTHILLSGSPAINAGNPTGCMGSNGLLTTDQRGVSRLDRCDIGAFEVQPLDVSSKTVNPTIAPPGTALTYNITLTNGGTTDLTRVNVTDTLPMSITYSNNSLTATGGSYGFASGVITWTGTLNATASVTITFGATVNQNVPPSSSIVNRALISADGGVIARAAKVIIPTPTPNLAYLPLVLKQPTLTPTPTPIPLGIYGHVTLNGVAASSIVVDLRFYNGSTWNTIVSIPTNSDGLYSFLSEPSLGPGQKYYVRYTNSSVPSRLSTWATRQLTSYTAGSNVAIGDFDVANIPLVAPPSGSVVALPNLFQWGTRPATPSDSYEFNLFDVTNGSPSWWTPKLGYVSGYTLSSLPTGFAPGIPYGWYVAVYSPDGGYGVSYYYRLVAFSNTGTNPAKLIQGAPKIVPEGSRRLPSSREERSH